MAGQTRASIIAYGVHQKRHRFVTSGFRPMALRKAGSMNDLATCIFASEKLGKSLEVYVHLACGRRRILGCAFRQFLRFFDSSIGRLSDAYDSLVRSQPDNQLPNSCLSSASHVRRKYRGTMRFAMG